MHQHLPDRDTGTSNALTGALAKEDGSLLPAVRPAASPAQLNLLLTWSRSSEVAAEAPDSVTQEPNWRLPGQGTPWAQVLGLVWTHALQKRLRVLLIQQSQVKNHVTCRKQKRCNACLLMALLEFLPKSHRSCADLVSCKVKDYKVLPTQLKIYLLQCH